jgi:hypothetical protein
MNNITSTINQTPFINLSQALSSLELVISNDAIDSLFTEGGNDFYNYVNRIGLLNDPSLIVLSSLHSYFYDNEEMNKAKTIINLTELNQIKDLKVILESSLHFMPQHCNYVGCFVNNKKYGSYALRNSSSISRNRKTSDEVELGIVSRYPFINMLYRKMDLKTNTYMSESRVILMLGIYGFKVLDMSELNGLTFFHSQKIKDTFN